MKKMTHRLMVNAVCWVAASAVLVAAAQERQGRSNNPAGQRTPVKTEGAIDLLASKNLDDWDYFLEDKDVKKEDVWSFNEAGNLVCKGVPMGYIRTKEEYQNFKLTAQWRWPEGTQPTNSGIFLRINGEPKPLPRCIETQLQHGNAGDLWGFHGLKLASFDKARFRYNPESKLGGATHGVTKIVNVERPAGAWNTAEILCQDGTIVVVINGTIVNWTKNAETVKGGVGLQSEGGVIEFRNVLLTTL
jgi:hypothetical protein